MYTIKHNNVFVILVAISFGGCYHHQANAILNFKKLVKCGA